MKFKLCLSLVFVLLILPIVDVFAQDITMNDFEIEPVFYRNSIDNLVLDFSIEGDEMLEILTVRSIGAARDRYEVSKLVLWADDGDGEFYIEDLVGESIEFIGGVWVFRNLGYEIVDSQRFFVTVETGNSYDDNRRYGFCISQKKDTNDNEIFDDGDAGIFLSSGIMENEELCGNSLALYRSRASFVETKLEISNLDDGDTLDKNSFIITGKSRSQESYELSQLQVCIDDDCHDVESVASNYSEWQYQWNDIENGEYEVYLKYSDYSGAWSEKNMIDVSVELIEEIEEIISAPVDVSLDEVEEIADENIDEFENGTSTDSTGSATGISEEYNSETHDISMMNRLSGHMLLRVGHNGSIGYVNPSDQKTYDVTWDNAMSLFENLAIGITEVDNDKFVFDTGSAASSFGKLHAGKMFLRVGAGGAITYVDMDGYGHVVTFDNLMPLFESVSLGISEVDYEKIPEGVLN